VFRTGNGLWPFVRFLLNVISIEDWFDLEQSVITVLVVSVWCEHVRFYVNTERAASASIWCVRAGESYIINQVQ
jgi:hypothetical protein